MQSIMKCNVLCACNGANELANFFAPARSFAYVCKKRKRNSMHIHSAIWSLRWCIASVYRNINLENEMFLTKQKFCSFVFCCLEWVWKVGQNFSGGKIYSRSLFRWWASIHIRHKPFDVFIKFLFLRKKLIS